MGNSSQQPAGPVSSSGATFSPCRTFRYTLWRSWEGGEGVVMFIGLNPSTADEIENDRTVNRCISFAKSWGYAGLCMTNLFAFRATKPAVMLATPEPIGPENDRYLLECAAQSNLVVAAWGTNGAHMKRDDHVRQLIGNLHYLHLTQDGDPGHPLYLPGNLKPVPWV